MARRTPRPPRCEPPRRPSRRVRRTRPAWISASSHGQGTSRSTSGQNLILTGPVGTGKTWAVWHAAERAVRSGYEGRVIITTAARFRRVVAPSTADPAEFTRYTDAGLLAIDDLGAARLSEWDMDHLGELVDVRWADQRPIIVTSNVTDLRTLLGPRISSRLAHNAVKVEMTGPDRRRKP